MRIKTSTAQLYKKSILPQWMMSCIIILLVPFISIVINYLISRDIINEQISAGNRVILSHMQNAIDEKLRNVRNLSYLLLLDNNFVKLSEDSGKTDFFSQAQICYEELNNYNYIYNDISILIYYPSQDYIVTNGVANTSASIYKSMHYSSRKAMPSYEQWMSVVNADYSKSRFFLDDYVNYNNTGKTSFSFACVNPFVYRESAKYNILVSSTADFVETNLQELPDSTFFICDNSGDILRQFGAGIDNLSSVSVPPGREYTTLNLSGTDFYCSYADSSVAGWTYVLCTPVSLYLRDSVHMRNVTLVSTVVSLLIGIFVVVYTQYQNYKPVKKIIDIIPNSLRTGEKNEFRQIEDWHGEMHRINLSMQSRLDDISKNVRELYFYSKLKGFCFPSHENDIIHMMNLDLLADKYFVIVSVYADERSFPEDDIMRSKGLLQFAVANVSEELLSGNFPFERIRDEFFQVFFFVLDDVQAKAWEQDGRRCFEQLHDFFEKRFRIDLFVTLSPVYKNFEQTAEYYSDMITTFEECHRQRLSGVHPSQKHSRSLCADQADFGQYGREINLAIFRHDYEKTHEIVRLYIADLKSGNFSGIILRYKIYSLVASILVNMSDCITPAARDTIDAYLSDSFQCSSLEEYEEKLNYLLDMLCERIDPSASGAQDRESQLVRRIKSYVENCYADTGLNVASVADALGLSPNYISRIFKTLTGEGLLSYINQVRINHAKELLRTTNINVDEVALMVGFSNSRSFRRNFQNLTGITASDYRNGV